jgi:23S rRNA (cytosine1962-C5)-methyltransferase
MYDVRLIAGREKAVLREHPWIFSGSIEDINFNEDDISPGETVRIFDSAGIFLAWGAYSPKSQIRVRIWSRDPQESIDEDFFRTRIERAIQFRASLNLDDVTNAYRLVHAESDGLPGLIADRYADTLVLQFLAGGAEFWREYLIESISAVTGLSRVYERSDVKVRQLEGLPHRSGILVGDDTFEYIGIREWNLKYLVDIRHGQKTGFYLDQRLNRDLVRSIAADCSVLDCFAYSGGFSMSALMGNAKHITAVDSSKDALKLGMKNMELNSLLGNNIDWVEGDVFQVLRKYRDQGKSFDMVVLDPPKFAPTAAHRQRAARGYKDINLLGFKLLNPGGKLVTFSCSGGVSEEFFQKILAGAALDAGVNAKIITRLGPGADHPVALSFPEGAYLKGLVLQI